MQDVSREFVVAAKTGRMNCPYCKSSRTNFNGRREDKQTYLCRECGKRWMQKGAMGGHSFPPDLIGATIQMYYNGFSLRNVARAIEEQFGIKKDISPETIRNWLDRYTDAAIRLTRDLRPPGGEMLWVLTICARDTQRRWQLVLDDRTGYICENDVGGIKEDDLAMGKRIGGALASATFGHKEIWPGSQVPPDLIPDFLPRWHSRSKWIGNGWVEHIDGTLDFPPGLTLPNSFHELEDADYRFVRNTDRRKIPQRLAGWMITRNFFTEQRELGGSTPGQASGIRFPIDSWADLVKLEARAFLPEVNPKADVATRHPSKEPASEGDCGSQG